MSTTPPPNPAPLSPTFADDGLAAAPPAEYTLRHRLADYRILVKPRITRLVVITAGLGFALAARQTDAWTWLGLIGTLVGTALSCMAASVFNQAYEHRTDALMPRTRNRPLAAQRLPMGEALALGAALTLAGQGLLCLWGTHLASALAAFTIFSYALIYTPLKRVSPLSLYVGSLPGAIPPLIGYAAVTGHLYLPDAGLAWLVFAVMAVWQVPHFLAIGYLYRDDYAAADLAMHAVRDPSGRSTFRNAMLTSVLLLIVSLLPTLLGYTGWIAFALALACGSVFLALAVDLWRKRDRPSARRLFFGSLIYLPIVLAALVLDAYP